MLYDPNAPRIDIELMLNEDLVRAIEEMNLDLSQVVEEALAAEIVARRREQDAQASPKD